MLILLYATFWVSLYTMIMKTFIDEVPRELDEAALIDGATTWQLLWRVILPLACRAWRRARSSSSSSRGTSFSSP